MNMLYRTLSHLNSYEWNQLIRAAQSTYWNTQEEIVQLLLNLQPFFTKSQDPPNDENLYACIYPNEAYHPTKWRLLRSNTLELVEQVLVTDTLMKDKANYRKHIITWYRHREATKNLTIHLNRAHKENDRRSLSIPLLHEIHGLELETYRHRAANRSLDNLNIPALLYSADQAYIAQKMRLLCYSISHQQVMAAEYAPELVDAILQHIRSHQWYNHALIGAYYFSYLALANDDKNAYHNLKSLLLKSYQQIDFSELKDITILAINYSIGKYRSGNNGFSQEVFDWYKFGIEKGPLTDQEKISPYTYRNAATIALRMKQTNWAEEFTEKYKDLLPNNVRQELFRFNMARIAYERCDYALARDYLWNVEHNDILLTLAHRTLQLKIYYLTKEYSLLDSTTDSFKAFLIRKKIAKSHSSSYLKFANFMRLMSRWKQYNPDKMENQRQRILKKIEREKEFPERQWFLDQLN